jgi:hypothetical protein
MVALVAVCGLGLAACGGSTSTTKSAPVKHAKPVAAVVTPAPAPAPAAVPTAANAAACSTLITDWNTASKDIGGTQYAGEGGDFTGLGSDFVAIGEPQDGAFLVTFGNVLNYDTAGSYTAARETKAANEFLGVLPKLKADATAKCGSTFTS